MSGKLQLNAVIERTKGDLEPGRLAQWLLPPRTYFFALHKHADLERKPLRDTLSWVAEAIHNQGSKTIVQINHAGSD